MRCLGGLTAREGPECRPRGHGDGALDTTQAWEGVDPRGAPPGLALVAPCALQAPSLRAFARERPEENVHPVDGIQRVPCDTHRREMLEPVSPEALRPVCKRVVPQVQRSHALAPLRFLDESYGLALDGPG
jgi:hypothetical protein